MAERVAKDVARRPSDVEAETVQGRLVAIANCGWIGSYA
jgi:hypothetical protein